MRNYLIYNGESSKDFGLYISGSGAFNAPERDVELLEIPGRNGSLTIDNGRYKNVTQSYSAFICRDFPERAEAVRAWLLAEPGYHRLEDTYDPEHFRRARFSGAIEFTVRALCAGAETELLFDCSPQRFLKRGEQTLCIYETSRIHNPTRFPALPLLTVRGSGAGNVTVGDHTIKISSIDSYVTIDCELQDAYKDGVNKNSTITATEFPNLPSGNTTISFTGGVTGVDIIPRWWTL